jgi:anti-anti-sigma factor
MALTIPPPAEETVPSVGSVPAIPLVHAERRGTVIALRGEADVSTRRALSDVLSRVIASRSGDVVIDLAQTTFIDTAIVRTLSEGRQLLVRQGNNLSFRSPSRLAARVLQVFGLTHLIEHATEVDRPPS